MSEREKRLAQLSASRSRRNVRRMAAQWNRALGLNRRTRSSARDRRFHRLLRQGRLQFIVRPRARWC